MSHILQAPAPFPSVRSSVSTGISSLLFVATRKHRLIYIYIYMISRHFHRHNSSSREFELRKLHECILISGDLLTGCNANNERRAPLDGWTTPLTVQLTLFPRKIILTSFLPRLDPISESSRPSTCTFHTGFTSALLCLLFILSSAERFDIRLSFSFSLSKLVNVLILDSATIPASSLIAGFLILITLFHLTHRIFLHLIYEESRFHELPAFLKRSFV